MCERLATDVVVVPTNVHKKALPANNGLLALSFAQALDKLLDGDTSETQPAKPHYLLYHRLLLHSSRHIIHKYKRGGESQRFQYKCWGIHNFESNEGRWFTYMEYPLTEDLYALKREVIVRTKIGKLTDEKMDDALDSVTDTALKPGIDPTLKDFLLDCNLTTPYLEILVNYVVSQSKA